MDQIVLTLEPREFEYLINVLGTRPFAEVSTLIAKLVQQANGSVIRMPPVPSDQPTSAEQ
jgi:hypothetical protein